MTTNSRNFPIVKQGDYIREPPIWQHMLLLLLQSLSMGRLRQVKSFCEKIGTHTTEASRPDITTWVVYRSEQTSSLNMVEANVIAVKCFWCHANKPISELPLVDSVIKGLLKNMVTKELNHLCLEPEMVQRLIHDAIYELSSDNFVGIRQAALYALMY